MPHTGAMYFTMRGQELLDKFIDEHPKIAARVLNKSTLQGRDELRKRYLATGLNDKQASRRVTMVKATESNLTSGVKYSVARIRLGSLQPIRMEPAVTIDGRSPTNKPFIAHMKRWKSGIQGVFSRIGKKRLKIVQLYLGGTDQIVSPADRDAMITTVQDKFKSDVIVAMNKLKKLN